MKPAFYQFLAALALVSACTLYAVPPPGVLNHQGRIAVSGQNYTGTGFFKFALVDAFGTTTLWSHDNSSTGGGQPASPVSVSVTQGHYALGLGDTTVANMTAAIPPSVFTANADVRLRVWFSANGMTFEQLTPDRRITSAGYALTAGAVADPSFIGTTTDAPLDLMVFGVRGLRIQPGGGGLATPSVIGGDASNSISLGSIGSVISGGGRFANSITNDAHSATIAGGALNLAGANAATIGGGEGNNASATGATISGGFSNEASGISATVPGGDSNTASGEYSFAAGRRAKAVHNGAFVWADSQNADFRATAVDQFLIRAAGGVGIGTNNPSHTLTISNTTNEETMRLIGAGSLGQGARFNFGDGDFVYLTEPFDDALTLQANEVGVGGNPVDGGAKLQVTGGVAITEFTNQLAANDSSGALTIGSVTGTSIGFDANDIQAYASQNVTGTLNVNPFGGNVRIGSAGASVTVLGTFVNSSDRHVKQDIQPVEPEAILDRLSRMPIATWQYKGAAERRHIGPMAQDFHAAFDDLLNLRSDDTTIAPLDEVGVAFASIQALYEKVDLENKKLQDENGKLKERLERLERTVEALTRPAGPNNRSN